MPHDFEIRREAELDATPEQVWEAIATGPGIDSWFMGRSEIEAGVVRTAFGDYTPESTVTAHDPLRRFAHHSGTADDGRFVAYEFLIEGRAGGSTVLRTVTSGFLPGDDWENEFEAMSNGLEMFFRTLIAYLTHFPGRTATPITAFGPHVADWDRAWATLRGELGLSSPAAVGDRVRFTPAGLEAVDGVVYFTNDQTLGIRTGDALYRFLQGFGGTMVAAHHVFTGETDEEAWTSWLTTLYGSAKEDS